jgi:hypothetical protein
LAASLGALLAIGLFAGGLWFAYLQGLRHASDGAVGGEVPLIRADQRPIKIKPDNPGGMEIPDRDRLIYTQKRAGVEHLLPPPEKPMPRPTASAVAAAQPAAPSASAAAGSAAAAVTAPVSPPAKPQQSAAKSPGSTASVVPAKPSSKTEGSRIQLGSVRSEEGARQEWDRIKRSNPDLLSGLSASPVRADLGERGVFYRILTAPIGDAERICHELNRRNVGCIVAR